MSPYGYPPALLVEGIVVYIHGKRGLPLSRMLFWRVQLIPVGACLVVIHRDERDEVQNKIWNITI